MENDSPLRIVIALAMLAWGMALALVLSTYLSPFVCAAAGVTLIFVGAHLAAFATTLWRTAAACALFGAAILAAVGAAAISGADAVQHYLVGATVCSAAAALVASMLAC